VFIGDDLPELGTDLVAALAALDVYEFAHCCLVVLVIENVNASGILALQMPVR
jgi:hypothetical protein